MLKIKDSVDLEKLKKYGFFEEKEYYEDGGHYFWFDNMFIDVKDRIIKQDDGINKFKDILEHKFNDLDVLILYHLIKDDLVENSIDIFSKKINVELAEDLRKTIKDIRKILGKNNKENSKDER